MKKNLVYFTLSILILHSMAAKFDESTPSNYLPRGASTNSRQLSNGKSNWKDDKSAPQSSIAGESYSVTIGGSGSSQLHQAPTQPVQGKSSSQQGQKNNVQVSPPSNLQQLPLAGGYIFIPTIEQDNEALAALEYLQQNLCPLLSTSTLLQSSYQVVNGINYQFIFQLEVLLNKRVKYFIQLYKPLVGKYQIRKSQYYELSKSKPKIQEFIHFEASKSKSMKHIDLINDQVLFQLKDLFNGKGQLMDFQARPPYFILNYRVGRSDVYKVEVLYDVVINAANILAITKQTITQSSSKTMITASQANITPAKQELIPTVTSASSSVATNKNQPAMTEGGTPRNSGGVVKQKIIKENQIPQGSEKLQIPVTKQSSPTIPQSSKETQSKPALLGINALKSQTISQSQTSLIRSPVLVVHSKPSQLPAPSFTIAQNSDRLLEKLSGISDPALIPFLTSSQSTNTKQIEEVARFLIEKVKITGDFTIVLINQIKYGIRLIIQMKEDHKLFEAVVTSDNQAPQILVWRRISAIGDADPDVFTQYFRINPDEDLKNLVRGIFNSDEMIRRFKNILSAEKKVSFDGIYYRVVLESTTNNRFFMKFYSIPDRKYNEIMNYQLLGNNFDARASTRLSAIPQNDPNFKIAQDYLFNNYGNVLKDSSLSFASTYVSKGLVYYRLVFVGLNGKYEAVVMVNVKARSVVVCRWQKMEDGYVPIRLEQLKSSDEFKSIRLSVKEYIRKKFYFDAEVKYLQVKSIPGYNSFYKFMFERPFPFILSLQERDSDHGLYIRGLERVQIVPVNEYYNDRLFAGYSSVRVSELQFDDVYQIFYTVLQKQTQIRDGNNEIAAAFRMKTPEGIYYKVIYRINGYQYLASFSYVFAEAKYKLVSFESYLRSVESGDYRWKCSQVDAKSLTCSQCEDKYILTAGRCYAKINGCSLQLASSCHACEPGFIRTNQLCEVSSQKSIPTPAPLSRTQKIIITATGPRIVTYQNGNDQNCLQYKNSGCTKCANRFYIHDGICKKIQDQCDEYSEDGACLKCYEGYYLSNQFCVALDPLCAEANSNGVCTRCYKNYINLDGKCYIKSNVEIQSSSDLPTDQLCLQWTGKHCSKCQFGCFLSKKTNRCTVKDPFCSQFDPLFEQCSICNRGYRKNAGQCYRIV